MADQIGLGFYTRPSERAEELTGQFNDTFNKTEHNEVLLTRRLAPFMDNIVVSTEGVIKLLKGLNPSKALGPDELHPRVLKELANELGPVFAHLFQQSLDAPSDWRPGRQHSFVGIDREIFSTVILSLPLIQEGQLSVSGERICTILVNRLED